MFFTESIEPSPFTHWHIKGRNTNYIIWTQHFPNLFVHWVLLLFQYVEAALSPGLVEHILVNADTIWKDCFCTMISSAETNILLFTIRLPQWRSKNNLNDTVILPSHQHCVYMGWQASTASPAVGKVSLSNTCCFHVRKTISTSSCKKPYCNISTFFVSKSNQFGIPLKT